MECVKQWPVCLQNENFKQLTGEKHQVSAKCWSFHTTDLILTSYVTGSPSETTLTSLATTELVTAPLPCYSVTPQMIWHLFNMICVTIKSGVTGRSTDCGLVIITSHSNGPFACTCIYCGTSLTFQWSFVYPASLQETWRRCRWSCCWSTTTDVFPLCESE